MKLNGKINYVWGMEKSFTFVMLGLSKLSESYTFLLICMALITNAFIIIRLWEFRDISLFEFTVVFYYISFYFYSFNIIRQMCAVAIVFWGTRFIAERKYIHYLLTIMIATIFHTTALLGLIMLATEVFQWRYLNKKQKRIIILGIATFPISVTYLISQVNVDKYLTYFTYASFNFGSMLFAKVIFFILSFCGLTKLVMYYENVGDKDGEYEEKIYYRMRTISVYYFIGLVLCMLGYFFSFMQRISIYIYLFECIYMGVLVKYKKIKTMYPLFIFVLYGYIFVIFLINGGQGQIPYLFYWQ